MTVFRNLRGTFESEFRIGLSGGTTIYSGTNIGSPAASLDDGFKLGDIFISTGGGNEGMFQKVGGDWDQFATRSYFEANFQTLDAGLTALADLALTGIYVVTASGASTTRSLIGTANEIAITNGTAILGNPTIRLANNPVLPGTGAVKLPAGTTGDQPAADNGLLRYDTTINALRAVVDGAWVTLDVSSGIFQPLNADLNALAATSSTGLYAITGIGTSATRTLGGTVNQIVITNPSGAAGDPIIALADDTVIPGTGAMRIPVGNTAQEPTAIAGLFRYDSDTNKFKVAILQDDLITVDWCTLVVEEDSSRFTTGLQLGIPTGGDRGLGTLNAAVNIYINNVGVALLAANTFPANQLISLTAGVATLSLERASVSPAISDQVGLLNFIGRDSGGASTIYGSISSSILGFTNPVEVGRLIFSTALAGTNAARLYVGAGIYTPLATGGDKGVDSLNVGSLFINNAQVPTVSGPNIWSDNNIFNGPVTLSGGTIINTLQQYIVLTDFGATAGPLLTLDRSSTSPIAGDLLGQLQFRGRKTSSAAQIYGYIGSTILNSTTGSEGGNLFFATVDSGVAPLGIRLIIGTGLMVGTTADPGHGKINILTGAQINGVESYMFLRRTVYATPGVFTWTKGIGTRLVRLKLVAGGGGGGGNDASSNRGGGGAGGGGSEKDITTAGATETVTVGAAGVGGATTVAGTAGGASSFGAHASATGGAGGAAGTSGGGDASAQPGVGSNGNINAAGGPGLAGAASGYGPSGAGGNGAFGMGGGGRSRNAGTVGVAAQGYGAGGGGSWGLSIAGVGTAGIVIVEEWG